MVLSQIDVWQNISQFYGGFDPFRCFSATCCSLFKRYQHLLFKNVTRYDDTPPKQNLNTSSPLWQDVMSSAGSHLSRTCVLNERTDLNFTYVQLWGICTQREYFHVVVPCCCLSAVFLYLQYVWGQSVVQSAVCVSWTSVSGLSVNSEDVWEFPVCLGNVSPLSTAAAYI